MNCRFLKRALFFLAFCTLGLFGACHKETGPPPPLPAEQIPAELRKGFAKAPEQLKTAAELVCTSLEKKDYTAAYEAVQALCALEATTEQKSLAARAMLTITGLLQTAQTQGDEKAGAALQEYKTFK